MFKRIMAPVDLAHVGTLGKALEVTGDLASRHGIPVTYVGVTSAAPSALGHTPEEYSERLQKFSATQAELHGIETAALMVVSHDPTTDVDDALMKAVGDTGADLVVMASHIPGLADHLWPSNGGKIAAHAAVSVFVVRP